MKKWIHRIFVFLNIMMLLSACGGGGAQGNDSSSTEDATASAGEHLDEASADADRILLKDGSSDYVIVRADTVEQSLLDAILDFRKTVTSSYGATFAIESDWSKDSKDGSVVENDAREILIGATNRRESVDVLAELDEDSYVVKWVGEKLVILGSDVYGTQAALQCFIEQYVQSGSRLRVPADIGITGTLPVQKEFLAEGADIRIMTYNLAGTSKDWDSRKDYIPDSIRFYLPDVIGVQECNGTVHELLASESLKTYYEVNIEKHSDNSTYNRTPIFYRSDLYTKIEAGVEFLRQRYEGTYTKSLSWVVLERKADGKRLIVVNMHGAIWTSTYPTPSGETYDSMRAKAIEWRNDNVMQMLEKITELQGVYGDIPAFTTGDYNFDKNAVAYSKMKTTGLSSSQETSPKSSSGASYHNAVGAKPQEALGLPIDHIFYFANLSEAYVYKIGMTECDLKASDHCPVYADFKLIK